MPLSTGRGPNLMKRAMHVFLILALLAAGAQGESALFAAQNLDVLFKARRRRRAPPPPAAAAVCTRASWRFPIIFADLSVLWTPAPAAATPDLQATTQDGEVKASSSRRSVTVLAAVWRWVGPAIKSVVPGRVADTLEAKIGNKRVDRPCAELISAAIKMVRTCLGGVPLASTTMVLVGSQTCLSVHW